MPSTTMDLVRSIYTNKARAAAERLAEERG
jgi:hypothetical protein